jgi:Cof subfamily protein (haloacid dehalogenase superfamily)
MKIFVSDYDGTFYKANAASSEIRDNITQINAWRNAGNIFIFATGRPVSAMSGTFVVKNLVYDYLVALNGGVVASSDHKVISWNHISHEVVTKIMKLAREYGFVDYSLTDGFVNHSKIKFSAFMPRFGVSPLEKARLFCMWKRLTLPIFKGNVSYEKIMNQRITQISLTADTFNEAATFSAMLNERFCDEVSACLNETTIDVNHHGLSKATGIGSIAKLLGVDRNNIYCMGDNYNDISMLESYYGFTVPNAPDELKTKAKGIYNTVGDAIRELLQYSTLQP